MVLKKSKIVRRQKSRNCWFLDTAAVGTRRSADAKVCGRFSEMPRGPSHRCARNASAALENFVPDPQKTFSTVSVKSGSREAPCPRQLQPQKQTFTRRSTTSAKYQKQSFAKPIALGLLQ